MKNKMKKILNISDPQTRTRLLLKVLSLVFAVSLWLFVAWDGAAPSARSLSVPIKYSDLQEGYSITNLVTQIDVTLEGQIENLALLDRDKVTAVVSVHDLRPGKYRLPVQLEIPREVRLSAYSPQTVDIELFRIIERTLRPTLSVVGDIPENLSLGDVTINPREVVARGHEASVLAIRRVEVRSTVESLARGINEELPIVLVSDEGEVGGVRVEPPRVMVKANLIDAVAQKRVPVRVFVEGTPETGFDIGSVSVSPDVVTLRGTKRALENMNEFELSPIDVTGHSENMDIDLPLKPPAPEITILSADRVNVRVEFNSAMEVASFRGVPISVEGRGVYDEWVISPSSVSLTVERTVASTEPFEMEKSPVELYVDVTNVVSSRLLLPVLARGVPYGVRVLRIDPAEVTVDAVIR
jgi:YbbR domain-containing protein